MQLEMPKKATRIHRKRHPELQHLQTTHNRYFVSTGLLLSLLLPTSVFAVPVIFSTSVDCNVGQGTVTRGGPFLATSCFEERSNPDTDLAILAQAQTNGRMGFKGFGFRTETLVGAGDVTGGSYFSSAFIEGELFDSFSVEAFGPSGIPVLDGSLTVQINIQGFLLAAEDQGGAADVDLKYSITVGNDGPRTRTFTVDGNVPTPPFFQNEVFTIPWTQGQPLFVSMTASSLGIATTFGEGGATTRTEFENSIEWGGILEVLDDQGNPVESFTALGADGTDWYPGAGSHLAVWFWFARIDWICKTSSLARELRLNETAPSAAIFNRLLLTVYHRSADWHSGQ